MIVPLRPTDKTVPSLLFPNTVPFLLIVKIVGIVPTIIRLGLLELDGDIDAEGDSEALIDELGDID